MHFYLYFIGKYIFIFRFVYLKLENYTNLIKIKCMTSAIDLMFFFVFVLLLSLALNQLYQFIL